MEKLQDLITRAIKIYDEKACPCAFPRFRQLVGIDCVKLNCTFMCIETELMINSVRPYFNVPKDATANNFVWTCKKCKSTYNYEWDEFNINLDRKSLRCTKLNTFEVGQRAYEPIPLYMGLRGYSYPPKTKITPVAFDEFMAYLLETENL